MKLFWILLLLSCGAFAQDELTSELDKLDGDNIEASKSSEEAPLIETTEEDLEAELNAESGPEVTDPATTVEAPDTLPPELSNPSDNLETDVTVPQDNFAEPVEPQAPVIEEIQESTVEESIPDDVFTPVAEPEPEPVQEEPAQEETLKPSTNYVDTQSDSNEASEFESRLNRIYNQFYKDAISEDAWKQIAGEKINESYTVQPGDTLWDISVTFFGNGHYWPKVWQLNDEITNPHVISPGVELRFVPGQLNKAPQLNITQGENGEAPVETAQSQTILPAEELAPVIPPPSKKSRSVLENLPPSLPMLVSKQYDEFDDDGFSRQKSPVAKKATNIYLTSYLTENEPESLGSVVEGDLWNIETAGIYDQIFVKMENAKPNDRYLVYNVGGKIKAAESGRYGYPIYCHAEIRIIENVNADKNIFKAIVVKSVFPLKVGALIARGTIPVANAEDKGSEGSTSGEIMGGDFEEERSFMGPQQTVYIDRGAEDGVQAGQIFSVRKNDRLRKPGTVVKEMKEQIARIKILKTDSKVSTAVVLAGREDVRPGDRFTSMINGEIPVLKDIEQMEQQENSPVETGLNSDQDPESELQSDETDEFIE